MTFDPYSRSQFYQEFAFRSRLRMSTLRGHQTVDVDGSFLLVFQKLQNNIADMEEALATIAEATGDAPKF